LRKGKTMGKNALVGLCVVAFAVAYGCSGSGSSSGGSTAYTLEQFQFPLTSTDVQGGEEVYTVFCESCHPGAGNEGDGPRIAGEMYPPAKFRWQVRAGASDMPAYGPDKISDQELESLLAYCATFKAVRR
jgi:mono/diheme cytochrome c family protein